MFFSEQRMSKNRLFIRERENKRANENWHQKYDGKPPENYTNEIDEKS